MASKFKTIVEYLSEAPSEKWQLAPPLEKAELCGLCAERLDKGGTIACLPCIDSHRVHADCHYSVLLQATQCGMQGQGYWCPACSGSLQEGFKRQYADLRREDQEQGGSGQPTLRHSMTSGEARHFSPTGFANLEKCWPENYLFPSPKIRSGPELLEMTMTLLASPPASAAPATASPTHTFGAPTHHRAHAPTHH